MMTDKRQSSDKVRHGRSTPDLGQKAAKLETKEAELEQLSRRAAQTYGRRQRGQIVSAAKGERGSRNSY